MKKLILIAQGIVLAALLFFAMAGTSSCTKEVTTIHDTTTITITDTVVPAVLTNTQILIKHTWEVQEVYQIVGGSDTTHFIRGGENTTGYNQALLRLTFNADGTGTYIGDDGANYTLVWQFTTTDEKNMRLIVTKAGVSTTYIWSFVHISEQEILQTSPGDNLIVSARWIPVP